MIRALIGGKVLTMAGPVYDPGIVLIKDGIILAVGEHLAIPAEAEVYPVEGRVVMPCLIEAHSHIGICEEIYQEEGDDLNEFSDPITPHLRALDAINPEDLAFRDAIRGGVTTVGTGPGSGNVIGGETVVMKTWGRTVDEMVFRQPAGLKVALGENPKKCYGQKQKMPMTRMATAALLRQTLVAAQNYRDKLKHLSQKPDEVPERDLKLEAVLRALNQDVPVKVHAHRADDIMTALRIGEEFGLDMVIEHGTEAHKIVEELLRRKVPVVVGPSLSSRSKVELKDKTFQTPGILARAGIKVALMTDHPVIPIEYLSLCAALAVKEGMSETDALKAVTINPAEILGVSERVGSLAPGKDADLLILSGSILDVRSRVEMVLVNGNLVWP
jgi:imidazolonepropionase-like amidohydrolase